MVSCAHSELSTTRLAMGGRGDAYSHREAVPS